MRILFTAPPYVGLAGERGGVYQEMRYRARSLESLGHEVVFLDVWREFTWRTFDVCHLFMANGDSCGLGLEIARHLPLVVSPIIDRLSPDWILRANVAVNDFFPFAHTHLGRCAELCRAAKLIVVRSLDEKRRVERGLAVRGKTLMALTPVAEPPTPARPREAAGPKMVFFLGDIGNPRKNVHRLIAAAKGLDARVVLAGSWPTGPGLAELRRRCAESGNIELMGPLGEDRKWEMLGACDVFVLPSLVEGIGLAAVEAGFLGKTVVVTSHGGARDYLGDDAYYVNPFDVAGLRGALRAALNNPRDPSAGLRRRLEPSRWGRVLVEGYESAIGAGPTRVTV